MSASTVEACEVARATGHVCWVVDVADDYVAAAAQVLDDGAARGLKPLAFGPAGSAELAALAPHAAVVLDPAEAFLGGGALDPGSMLAAFREQTALARADGYLGVCVVADMDWLLVTGATWQEVVAFEAQLEAVVHGLGATVVCVYRRGGLDAAALTGAGCVHPGNLGPEAPSFQLTCRDAAWVLSGEVDFSSAGVLAAGLSGAQGLSPLVVDVSALKFLDVAGMRALARAASVGPSLVLHGASPWLRRLWEVSGFDAAAPDVQLVGEPSRDGVG